MGGDGGTISSSRLYLRGAGKASHTADHPSNAHKRAKLDETERARLILSTCGISGTPLDLSPAPLPSRNNDRNGEGSTSNNVSRADIVVCPYGKIYKREAILEALLQRSQNCGITSLGSHIRGMKDLHPVRFYVTTQQGRAENGRSTGNEKNYVPICPITGSEIWSGNSPSFVIVRCSSSSSKTVGKKPLSDGTEEEDEVARNPNVLSERAIKEMGIEGLQSEYGPFQERDLIRLAPPVSGGVFQEIQHKWEARMEEERIAKLLKKKDNKRKRNEDKPKRSNDPSSAPTEEKHISGNTRIDRSNHPKKSAAEEARSSVHTAVASNPVLSSLFGSGKSDRSEREKRNALFAHNC